MIAIALGFGVGVAVETFVGKPGREAWDSEQYWTIGLGSLLLAALVGGFIARTKPWVIGYAPFAGQAVQMAAESGDYSLLPLGLILMGVVGLPGVALASAGAWLGRRVIG
ncbi:MAG: hypothetical protein ABIR70_14250 [Bryobacteraceae bacterium]